MKNTDSNTYYYNQLNKQQQKAYYAIKSGLESMAKSFFVPRLDGKELADIYFKVRLDCPKLFYSVNYKYRYYPDSENVEMIPEYLFQKNKLEEHKKAMESRIKKLVRQAENLNEKEKERFIHDFICENVHYDKLKKAYSHEIIGPLGQGVGVCEGIAKTVKVLMDALGMWCIIAVSEANPKKNIKYRHAWNVIRMGDCYYHLDATFDNSLTRKTGGENCSGIIRYDYMNLSDMQIFRDHEPVIWNIPTCNDSDHTHYREKKLSFTKLEEVQKRAAQAVKKKKTLLFHWRGSYMTRDVLKKFLQIFEEEAAKKDKYAYVSLNWKQAVVLVSFEEQKRQLQVEVEEANEGESLDPDNN